MKHSPSPVYDEPISVAVRAAQSGDIVELRQLLESGGICASDCDGQGCSLLQWAAINGRSDAISLLLEHGADPSATGGVLQETPLQWASRQGHFGCIGQLLQADMGCIGHRNVEGRDAAFICVTQGSRRGLLLLAAHGADVTRGDKEGLCPLSYACKFRPQNVSLIRTLLTLGADPATQADACGNSPLHFVACQQGLGGAELVRTLRGANRKLCFRRNRDGKDPIALARDKGSPPLAAALSRIRVVQRLPPLLVTCLPSLALLTVLSGFVKHGLVGLLVSVSSFASLLARYGHALSPTQQDCLGVGCTWACLSSYFLFYALRLRGGFGVLVDLGFSAIACVSLYYMSKVRMTPLSSPTAAGSGAREALRALLACKPGGDTGNRVNGGTGAGEGGALLGNGTLDLRRLCDGCLVLKSTRARHCVACDRCVRRFDHHCAFLATCVGQDNHVDFVLCLVATLGVLVTWLVLACLYLIRAATEGGQHGWGVLNTHRAEVVIVCLASLSLCWLSLVAGFQLWLIGLDLTCYEYFKQPGRSGLSVHKWCRNVAKFFGSHTRTPPPSRAPLQTSWGEVV